MNPGVNQVLRSPRALSRPRIRRAPMSPNSPRDSDVGVDMPRVVTLPADQLPMYVGTYASRLTPPTGQPYDVDFVIRDDAGTLKIKALKRDIFGQELVMIPVVDGRFHVAYTGVETFKGQLFSEPGMIFAFEMADGHAQSLEMYGYDQTVVARGALKK